MQACCFHVSLLFPGSTTVSFDGNQFMLVSLPETTQTEAEDIAVRFKTRRSNGLLLATTAANQSDSLMIRIEAGQVFVELRLGGDMEVSTRVGVKYSTCTWYLYLNTYLSVLAVLEYLVYGNVKVLVLVLILDQKVLGTYK